MAGLGSLRRPIDVGFDRGGDLHVLDFGHFEMTARGVAATAGSGALWRVAGELVA